MEEFEGTEQAPDLDDMADTSALTPAGSDLTKRLMTLVRMARMPNVAEALDETKLQEIGKKVKTEAGAFKAVAGLGIDTVEKVLEYHVVPGATILSSDALKANGAKLKTALPGKVIRVTVTGAPSIILKDYNPKLANPKVILTQVDINKGNKQVAHGIDAVLLPTK